MNAPAATRPHSFHVPVMGIGFTIDTAIRLAPLGIDSSISLVNDDVIEAARAHHCRKRLLPYDRIESSEPEARARRITAYLNLVVKLVGRETERLRQSSFDAADGIRRYFELLPSDSPERKRFVQVESMPDGHAREQARDGLRPLLRSGSIGVNIMTKLDGALDEKGEPREAHHSDAQAALRGFALSKVRGPLILSAGANPGLFAYISEFDDFFPDSQGITKKTVVLKVSDFRSAHVQGRLLTRRGVWVAEYRIESGLNCGGHAFPTEGLLMGPILQTFKERRDELAEGLFPAYSKGLKARGLEAPVEVPAITVTAQGGIGTAEEDHFLRTHFGLDGTGWGSPFLMVPEAVLMDPRTTQNLIEAKAEDIELTWNSPLGVRFWWLKTSQSEEVRAGRVERGHSGSTCTARHLALNTQYGKVPLCPGSRAYQKRKQAELDRAHPDYELQVTRLQAPACICVDLCGSFLSATGDKKAPPPAVCPGPNIVNFQQERSLEDMVGHIYGRTSVITRENRPHLFVREVELYLEVFDDDLRALGSTLQGRNGKQLGKMLDGLAEGLAYYAAIAESWPAGDSPGFEECLPSLSAKLETRRQALTERTTEVEAQMTAASA